MMYGSATDAAVAVLLYGVVARRTLPQGAGRSLDRRHSPLTSPTVEVSLPGRPSPRYVTAAYLAAKAGETGIAPLEHNSSDDSGRKIKNWRGANWNGPPIGD
jgi:hypothetical protein